jgi:O-antigen ligase
MLIGFILCLILEKNKLRNMLILITISVTVINFAPSHFFTEMETLSQGAEESTADDRIYLWGVGMDMFYDSPIFGVGMVNYPQVFPKFEKQKRYRAETLRVPHSTPVQWLAETGLVGLFIMLTLQRSLFKNWRECYKNRQALSISNDGRAIYLIAQSIGIAQIVFWFCALFLSLLPYPFYWILIPLSEAAFVLSNKTLVGEKESKIESKKNAFVSVSKY